MHSLIKSFYGKYIAAPPQEYYSDSSEWAIKNWFIGWSWKSIDKKEEFEAVAYRPFALYYIDVGDKVKLEVHKDKPHYCTINEYFDLTDWCLSLLYPK